MLFRACFKEAASHRYQTTKEQLRKYLFRQQHKLTQPPAADRSVMGAWLLAQLQVNQIEEVTQVKGVAGLF